MNNRIWQYRTDISDKEIMHWGSMAIPNDGLNGYMEDFLGVAPYSGKLQAPATCAQRWFKRSVSFSSLKIVWLPRRVGWPRFAVDSG